MQIRIQDLNRKRILNSGTDLFSQYRYVCLNKNITNMPIFVAQFTYMLNNIY
jgi:hypothetical protein